MQQDWLGKVHNVEELKQGKEEEAAALAAHPGPVDWDQYGGWKNGPQLTASGRFRVEKIDARWWLVDPEGRLFWANGGGWGSRSAPGRPAAGRFLRPRFFTFKGLQSKSARRNL